MLNNRQKFGLIFGLIAICAICICPPWRLYGAQEKPLGFALIFNPPVQGFSGEAPGKIDLDNSRLTLEIVLASVITAGLFIVGGSGSARPGVGGQANQGGFVQRMAEMREQMIAAQQAQLAAQSAAQNATAPAAKAAAAAASSSSSATSQASPGAAAKAPLDANYTRIELPANYYLGELLVESDDDPEYWESFGAAKGVVDIPKNKKVQLELAKDIRVDLAVLKAFPSSSLYSIDASECKVTDEDIVKLASVTGLRELDLAGTPVGSSGVSKLRALGQLEKLWLDRTLINDECVPALGSLSKLKKLSLTETKINELALESLRKDLSSCEVVT